MRGYSFLNPTHQGEYSRECLTDAKRQMMNDIDDREQDSEQGEGVHRNGNIAGRNTWGGQYCCVLLCRSSSGERQERQCLGMPRLSFHSFPDLATERGKMWVVIRHGIIFHILYVAILKISVCLI